MNQTYHITGMTCNNCRQKVKQTLQNLKEVEQAEVNLDNESARLFTSSSLSIQKLQSALSAVGNYNITKTNQEGNFESQIVQPSKLKQLKPLFIILGSLFVASAIIVYSKGGGAFAYMRYFMGLFFLIFSLFKLQDLKNFPSSFTMYDPIAKLIPGYAWAYPFIELGLAFLFLLHIQLPIALVVSIVLLSATLFGVTKSLLSNQKIKCACLGTALNLPMTEATFIENVLMIGMAVYMLIQLL